MKKAPIKKQLVPIKEQVVPVDYLAAAEWTLKRGESPSNEQIVRAIENSSGQPLPPLLRAYIVRLILGEVKLPRGRPPVSQAKLTFAMPDVDTLYRKLHRRFTEQRQRQRKD